MNVSPKFILGIALVSCGVSSFAHADNQTVSLGYAQSKVQDYKNIRGVNLQYRYEWDSPISVVGSFSYMTGDKTWSEYDEANDYYHQKTDVKSYSLLAGPAYRFNDMVSVYGLVGVSHIKAKADYSWVNSVGGDLPSGHAEGSESVKSTSLAYGVGVIVNPTENFAVNVGYEGTRADLDGHTSLNGFNVGVGYRF